MEIIRTIFFDTYAFHEVIAGSESYQPYQKGVGIVTTRLNLMELHYGLLLKYGKTVADHYYYRLLQFAVDASDELGIRAIEFRAEHKAKGLSYVDCIGYIVAKSRNVKFLTGDKGFADLENVEYVKAE